MGRAAACFLLLAAGLNAQTALLQMERGPYYAGESLRVQVSAEGFDEEPAPQLEFEPVDGARLTLVGMSPSVNESITIVNGSVSRRREVKHVFELRLIAESPGELILPSVQVVQGDKVARSGRAKLELRA